MARAEAPAAQAMTYRVSALVSFAVILLMFAAAFLAWNVGVEVDRVAVHFGPQDAPDVWMPAPVGWFVVPLLALVTVGLSLALPLINQGVRRNLKPYGLTLVLVTIVLAVAQFVIVAPAFRLEISATRATTIAVGILFIGVGNVFGKVRQNSVIGIRTPWTLEDEWVWDQTHRFAGRAFVVAGGTLLVAGAAAASGARLVPTAMIILVAVVLLPIFQSYLLFRQTRTEAQRRTATSGRWLLAATAILAVCLLMPILSEETMRPGGQPNAGTEESLRRYIASLQRGAPNYDEMSPLMADTVRRQFPAIQERVRAWGALKSVTFKGIDLRGFDNYEVVFERGRAEWKIGPLDPDGKVTARSFRELR